ncbi:hypothetical protein TNCV_4061821 [Trichonephila clavipes]|nr:hypothetical protein TNCV_4061821 [Trichonephila clavipes]
MEKISSPDLSSLIFLISGPAATHPIAGVQTLMQLPRNLFRPGHLPNSLFKPTGLFSFMPPIISEWRRTWVCTLHPTSCLQPPLVLQEQKSVWTKILYVTVSNKPHRGP